MEEEGGGCVEVGGRGGVDGWVVSNAGGSIRGEDRICD